MPLPATTLLSPTELAYLHSSLAAKSPLRPDARTSTTFRPLSAETDLLPGANGSARVCFADGMEGIAGVKAEVEATASGDAHAAWVEVSVDMPGQRDDDLTTTYLGQMMLEALVADGRLSERLRINERWHWKLFIDVGQVLR